MFTGTDACFDIARMRICCGAAVLHQNDSNTAYITIVVRSYYCVCSEHALSHLILSANDKLPFRDNEVSTPHIRAPVADGDVIPLLLL
jgi:hypothetical protein